MSHTMGYNAREDSCAFGGIEIKAIFFVLSTGPVFASQRGAVNPRSPGGVPEAKRGAAFCAASTRAAGQGLTGGAERSAIVAGQKDKSDRSIAERLSGAMQRWWAYIKAAGIEDDRKGWLFRSAIRKPKKLTASPITARISGAWCAAVFPMRELKPRSAATVSAPPASPTICPTAAASRSRKKWPGTRTPKPPGFMIGVTTM